MELVAYCANQETIYIVLFLWHIFHAHVTTYQDVETMLFIEQPTVIETGDMITCNVQGGAKTSGHWSL